MVHTKQNMMLLQWKLWIWWVLEHRPLEDCSWGWALGILLIPSYSLGMPDKETVTNLLKFLSPDHLCHLSVDLLLIYNFRVIKKKPQNSQWGIWDKTMELQFTAQVHAPGPRSKRITFCPATQLREFFEEWQKKDESCSAVSSFPLMKEFGLHCKLNRKLPNLVEDMEMDASVCTVS